MKKIKILSAFILSMFCLSGFAQQDTAFWFAVPKVSMQGVTGTKSRTLYLSSIEGTDVEISQPATGTSFTMTVFPNSTVRTLIPDMEVSTPNVVMNTGLHLRSTDGKKFNCMYDVRAPKNADIFSLKGNDALGTKFYIPGQNIFSNDCDGNYTDVRHSFDIVATEDGTVVTVTPKKDILAHPASAGSFNINLNKGQTFSCEGSTSVAIPYISYTAAGHLVGTKVTSNKPIAITVKDDSPQTSSWTNPVYQLTGGITRDLLGEQIVPVERVGTEYVIYRGRNKNAKSGTGGVGPDFFFVTATENGTQISVNGQVKGIINETDTYQGIIPHDTAVFYISTSKPVYLWHVSGVNDELAGTLVPPMICSGSKEVIITRPNTGTFLLNVVIMSGFENTLRWNGNTFGSIGTPSPPVFVNVPGTTKYKAAQLTILTPVLGDQAFAIIKSNAGAPLQVGMLSADTVTCRYTYPTNFDFFDMKITGNKKSLQYCAGDTIQLFTDSLKGLGKVNYDWIGPLGSSVLNGNQENILTIPDAQPSHSGAYSFGVKADSIYCTQRQDTVYINVEPKVKPDIGSDKQICEKESIKFNAEKKYDTYSWALNANVISQDSIIITQQAGIYTLDVTYNGCKGADTAELTVHPLPKSVVTMSSTVCYRDSADVQVKPEGLEVYCQIYHVGTNTKLLDVKIDSGDYAIRNYKIYPVGTGTSYYRILLTSKYGCITRDSVPLTVVSAFINLGKDTVLCEPNTVKLTAPAGYTYLWSTGATTQSITVSKTDSLWVEITDAGSGCMGVDSINVNIYPLPKLVASISEDVICPGDKVTVSADSAATYLWTSLNPEPSMAGQTTFATMNLQPYASNTYYVKGTSSYGCSSTANVSVTVSPAPEARIDAKPIKVSYLDPRVTFRDISLNSTSRIWDFGDGTSSTEQMIVHEYPKDTSVYTVALIVKNDGGCADTAYVVIIVEPETSIYIPNAFVATQEGKDYNVFKVYGNYIGAFELRIFDRWGKEVFYTQDINQGWDGTYKGQQLSEGVYMYIVTYIDNRNLKHMKKGSVTFIR